MKRVKAGIFLSVALLTLATFISFASVAHAEPSNQAEASLTEDFYCTIDVSSGTPTCNVETDGGSLRVQSGSGEATIASIVRFDLNGVGFSVAKARLNLALGHGPCTVDNVAVNVYSTANDDADPAQMGSLLATIDGGQTEVPFTANTHAISEAYQHWTDEGAGSLASHIETERSNDGIVTLWIQTTALEGSMNFEDSEATLTGGCDTTYTLGPPILQLADTDQPLAVTNLSPDATSAGISPFVWVALLIGVIAITGIALASRKQTEMR